MPHIPPQQGKVEQLSFPSAQALPVEPVVPLDAPVLPPVAEAAPELLVDEPNELEERVEDALAAEPDIVAVDPLLPTVDDATEDVPILPDAVLDEAAALEEIWPPLPAEEAEVVGVELVHAPRSTTPSAPTIVQRRLS